MYKVLLVDDDKQYSDTLVDKADVNYDMEIVHFTNWQHAFDELNENFIHYHAVILDGKGQLNEASKSDDKRHVMQAVRDLSALRRQNRNIRYVINTGYFEDIDESFGVDGVKIYDKSTDEDKMLQELKEYIDDLPKAKIKFKFPEAIKFAESYFSKENQEVLYGLLSENEIVDSFTWKKDALENLRRLSEALADTIPGYFYGAPYDIDEFLAKINSEQVLRRNANKGNRTISFVEYYKYSGNQIPDPIFHIITNTYHTASSYASHNNIDNSKYFPSKEFILGLLYAHIGCYHWFKEVIEKQHKMP